MKGPHLGFLWRRQNPPKVLFYLSEIFLESAELLGALNSEEGEDKNGKTQN